MFVSRVVEFLIFDFISRTVTGTTADGQSFDKENTVIIFDSLYRALSSEALIVGSQPWKQMLEELDLAAPSPGNPLIMATLRLIFDAVAGTRSDYIFHMHNYVTSLEEKVYK